MTLLLWIAALITGFLASMGVGGGMVLIIWMTVFMGTDQLDAQGINLIFFLPIALMSVLLHRKNGLISVKELLPAIITGVIGAVTGAFAAQLAGTFWLKKMFAVFMLIIGLKELLGHKKCEK